MTRKFVSILVLLTFSTSFTGLISGSNVTIPFEDGFENISDCVYPSENGWSVIFAGTSAYVTSSIAKTGSKSFAQETYGYARYDGITISIPDKLTYSADIYLADSIHHAAIGFTKKISTDLGEDYNYIRFDNVKYEIIAVGASSETRTVLQSYSINTWYHIEVTIDYTISEMDIKIDGVEKATGLTAAAPTVTNLFTVGTGDGLTYFDNIIISGEDVSGGNSPPTASFIISSYTGDSSTVFSCDASGSYDYEDSITILQVRWDWGDGEGWTSYTTVKTTSHQYSTAGSYSVRLEVKDSGGLVSSTSKGVTVEPQPIPNSSPVASFIIYPSSGNTLTTFEFDASSSYDSEDAVSLLQVRWDMGDGSGWTSFTTVKTISHQYLNANTYTVNLEVKDTEGLTDLFSRTVDVTNGVTGNTAPTSYFIVTPNEGDIFTYFEFVAHVSDVDDDEALLEIRWDWESDGTWDTDFSKTKCATHRYISAGHYNVKMEARDTGDLRDLYTRTVMVAESNTQPIAEFSFDPVDPEPGEEIFFNACDSYDCEDCSDGDDSTCLRYRWDWESDGTWDTDYLDDPMCTHTFDSKNMYIVNLEVIDSDGMSDYYSKTILVEKEFPWELTLLIVGIIAIIVAIVIGYFSYRKK